MYSKVDDHISKAKNWQKEMILFRSILLDFGLEEEYKWRQPCYSLNNKNIVLIGAFKEYYALLFFKGALLQNQGNILVIPTENSQSGRQIRVTNVAEIKEIEALIKANILEAIEVEKAGLKVQLKKASEFDIPSELSEELKRN